MILSVVCSFGWIAIGRHTETERERMSVHSARCAFLHLARPGDYSTVVDRRPTSKL
jgi:hypothetical protein